MRLFLLVITTLFFGAQAQAQSVGDCDWQASAQALVEPWEENSRTFSNGKTRLALLVVIEPAAGAFHILILSPPYDELGGRQCRSIGMSPGIGFFGADFGGLEASYDPSVGLMFAMPVQVYEPDTGLGRAARLYFSVNQATGQIKSRLQGGG